MKAFEFSMSALLSEKVVTEMITSIVEQQAGRKVIGIEYLMKEVSHGGQRDPWTTWEFNGAKILFAPDDTTY